MYKRNKKLKRRKYVNIDLRTEHINISIDISKFYSLFHNYNKLMDIPFVDSHINVNIFNGFGQD